jgi:hypothetical protein
MTVGTLGASSSGGGIGAASSANPTNSVAPGTLNPGTPLPGTTPTPTTPITPPSE